MSSNSIPCAAQLCTEYDDLITELAEVRDGIANGWDTPFVTNSSAITEPLEDELRDRGLMERFLPFLVALIDSTEFSLAASPVAAPPYVCVTSRGPLLRAPVESGRVVILFSIFSLQATAPAQYYPQSPLRIDATYRTP